MAGVCCHLSKALRSDGDKGMTDSKDRPGVGRVMGQASAKAPRFMSPQTTGLRTRYCYGM